MKINARTMDNKRGRFARLCVQVDLDQPLTPRVRIDNNESNMKAISAICFECSCIGHKKETCPTIISTTKPPPSEIRPDRNSTTTQDEEDSTFGAWMVVSKCKPSSKKPLAGPKNPDHGQPKKPATRKSSMHLARNPKPRSQLNNHVNPQMVMSPNGPFSCFLQSGHITSNP